MLRANAVVLNGKGIVEHTKLIKAEKIGYDKPFINYKITLKYQGKQFTFTYEEFSDESLKVSKILHELIQIYNDIAKTKDFETYFRTLNYKKPDDLERAKYDYSNGIKIFNGLRRVYGQDLAKLFNFYNS